MSIHFPVLQGSHEWRMCRLGLPTASNLSRILTPKKLAISKPGITTLASDLVAERAMMQPLDIDLAGFAQRGDLLEQEAVPWYEMQRDVTVSRDGFYFDPDRLIGASPDGLTPDSGLEVKSLAPSKHLRMMMNGAPSDYMAQVQTCMWICGREQWDLLFYHPSLPSRIITIPLDGDYVGLLEEALEALAQALNDMMTHLDSAGVDFGPWREHLKARCDGKVPEDPYIIPPRKWDLWRG